MYWGGGVLSAAQGTQLSVSWLIEIAAYCAVDCYAIISGFVCYREAETKYHYTKYISFWVPIFTYSFGITLCTFILKPEAHGFGELIRAALPISTSLYWYANAYTGLFFIIPWLNKLVRSCSKSEMNILALLIFFVFSCYATVSSNYSDVFRLESGYSFAWLTILYTLGAWIKKCDISHIMARGFWIALSAVCILITWLTHVFVSSLFVTYISPSIVIVAISLVAFFSTATLTKKLLTFTAIFSPAAFGVYVLHLHHIIWNKFIDGKFAWIATSVAWKIPFEVFISAAAVFVVCIVVERIRISVFNVLGISKLILIIERLLERFLDRNFIKVHRENTQ